MALNEQPGYRAELDLDDIAELDAAFESKSYSALENHSTEANTSQPSFHTFKVPLPGRPKLTSFAFINSTGPEIKTPETRKLVRKYATQSRDSRKRGGSSKKTPPLLPSITSTRKGDSVDKLDAARKGVSEALAKLSPISRLGVSGNDPSVQGPFEITPRDERMLSYTFDQSRIGIVPHRDEQWKIAFEDEAAFHMQLANIAMQMMHHNPSALKIDQYEYSEIVFHHTQALKIVQQRLADPKEATSNGTISAIISLIIHSHLTGDFKMWHSHIEGLRQIINLRYQNNQDDCEIRFLALDKSLRRCLAWADVAGCVTQDIPPRFPLTTDFDPTPNNDAFCKITPKENIPPDLVPSPVAIRLTESLRFRFPKHTEIFNLFDKAGNFVSRLKSKLFDSRRNICKDTLWSCQNLHPLNHRLLSYRAPVKLDDFGSVIQEVCRLCLLLFFTQTRKYLGIAPKVEVHVYIDKLIPLFDAHTDWGEFNIFKLWAIVLGAMQAGEEERKILLIMLRELLATLGIMSHAKAEDELKELLWIGEIHGINFWELYREVWMINV